MGRKTEIIETLQVSIRIANDAIEALKKANAIKATDNVKLKVRNTELTEVNRSLETLYDNAKVKIGQLNEEIAENQIKYDDLHDLYEQTKEERDTSEKGVVLSEVNKPRTYFEIASSEREFKVGEVVHVLSTEKGISFSKTIHANNTNVGYENYPLLIDGYTLVSNGKDHEDDELRRLFTTAEMIEMGYTIPDVE